MFYVNFTNKGKVIIDFTYVLGNKCLLAVTEVKDLGIHFSSNLCFNNHVQHIVSKSFQMLGFIRRIMKPFTDVTLSLFLYNSLVWSRLEYCSQVWSPSGKTFIDKIERVQKRFVKQLTYVNRTKYFETQYDTLCNNR